MTIRPITPSSPACYGVCCERHHECARYAAVETAGPDDTVATCQDGAGARPWFVRAPVAMQRELRENAHEH